MFKWSIFPFVRYTLFLSFGILVYQYFPFIWDHSPSIATLFMLLFLTSIWLNMKSRYYMLKVFHGVLMFFSMAFFGGWHVKMLTPHHSNTHYTHNENIEAFSGTIVQDVEERERYLRLVVAIDRVVDDGAEHFTDGLVQIYLRKPTSQAYNYGDALFVEGTPLEISAASNPLQFDYRSYQFRKRIYAQVFVTEEQLSKVSSENGFWVLDYGYKVRKHLRNLIIELIPNTSRQSIALALILGVKDGLDSDLKLSYATVGVSHILAVSGLHIGIIYLFLSLVLKPILQLSRGKFLFVGLTLLGVWFYAIITGLSASVFRAAIMFSILSLADLVGREKNINNSLGIAAFVLLLIDPNYLFQVGFQLSFIAVFGIVYLFPRMHRWLSFDHWLSQKIWSLTCVSLAAQISTVPLTIYYFHQFPTYFIFSNWVVIPFSFIILLLGLPMLLFGVLYTPIGQIVAWCLDYIIFGLNFLIRIFGTLPNNTLEGIFISTWQLFLAYGFLITFSWSRQYKTFWNFAASMVFLGLFFASEVVSDLQVSESTSVVIYDIYGVTALDFLEGNQARFVTDDRSKDPKKISYAVSAFRESIDAMRWDQNVLSLANSFTCRGAMCYKIWNGLKIITLQSASQDLRMEKRIEADLLMISNNSLKHIKELKAFKFKYLVFDSSNSPAFIERMKNDCLLNEIKAHFVPIDGYWYLDLRALTKL